MSPPPEPPPPDPDDAPATTPSPNAAAPYRNARQVDREAQRLCDRHTRVLQRQQIIDRLAVSGELAARAVPSLLECFAHGEASTCHAILDLLGQLQDQGVDLSGHAKELARHLQIANYALREKLLAVLTRMGPDAEGAIPWGLSLTRHALRDVRLAALRLLTAVGARRCHDVLSRLRAMRRGLTQADMEMVRALEECRRHMEAQPADDEESP